MYGLTRGLMTLIGVAIAGGLIWLASWIGPRDSVSDYWIAMGLVGGAGLVMALSQLLGGWTKWGVPRVSGNVLLLGLLPALVVGGWIIVAAQPETSEAKDRVISMSNDIGITNIVDDVTPIVGAVAFGLGLVFGLIFDTTGPRRREEVVDGDRRYADADGRDFRGRHAEDDPRLQRGRAIGAVQHRGDRDRNPEDEPVTAERGRAYDNGDGATRSSETTADGRTDEPVGVGARDERATPSAPQPEPEEQPRRRSFFRR